MAIQLPPNDKSMLSEAFAYEVDDYDIICRSGSSDAYGYRMLDSEYETPNIEFDSIFTDEKTCAVFRRLLQHSREHTDIVSFPYRCDTETLSQYYRLTVSLSGAGRVMFYNKMLGYDQRKNGVRWERKTDGGNDATPLCSICNKLFVNDGWMEFQEMVDTGLWPAQGVTMDCSYTVCAQCERGIDQRINESLNFSHE